MNGLVGVVILLLGVLAGQFLPLEAGERLALSDLSVDSTSRIPFERIKVYPTEVSIDVAGVHYAKVASNSMAPLITDTSTVLEKAPQNADEIQVGDVISFYEPSVDGIVLHLVIEKLESEGEVSFRTQGTANPEPDPWIVSYSNVKGVLVGVLK
ncbi:signal peptidase I [Candidatus Woesearchaeota archaeon]|nr:signal peptidase I [Candidatus Woesearchaeota archaeon]